MGELHFSEQEFAYIQEQAAGASQTPEQYVCALIRAERQRRALAELEAKLLEGIESGAATEMTRADWEELRRQVRATASVEAER